MGPLINRCLRISSASKLSSSMRPTAFIFISLLCIMIISLGGFAYANPPVKCDDGLKVAFKPDANTTVVSVRRIIKGQELVPVVAWTKPAPVVAATDMCLVKLLIGPGSVEESDRSAPSWSAGIGIEVWLPAPEAWNHRIRNFGGGGWAGGPHRDVDKIGSPTAAILAANLGFATASTDAGHRPLGDVSYAFLSNGDLNASSLNDFIIRSVVEMAIKTKALIAEYYGEPARFSYFEGGSTGGRQGLKMVQDRPSLYDGYLVGYPGINAPRFGVAAVYPQIVLRKELGFTSLDRGKVVAFLKKANAVTVLAVKSCDKENLGFLIDPFSCDYDPLKDAKALCTGEIGSGVRGVNLDPDICVTSREAAVINRIWYGQTTDGTWDPRQSVEDRGGRELGANQVWWGPNRGTPLAPRVENAYTDNLVQALHRVELAADASATSFPPLRNASTSVRNRWLELDYGDLARASDQGMGSPIYGPYASDKVDLSELKSSGAKVVIHMGLSDQLIPPAGTLHWYQDVAEKFGGYEELGRYMRLYAIPGELHSSGRTFAPAGDNAAVPVPRQLGGRPGHEQDSQMFEALMNWVENGVAPEQIAVKSQNGKVSYPLCLYPKKMSWSGKGSSYEAQNYSCE